MSEAGTQEVHEAAHESHHGDAHHDDHHHEQSFFMKYLWSTDHKMIAMQYMFTGMFMALIGGFFAYAFRVQLA
jgi:cytochrome c oxidase subunit 1